MRNRSKFDWSKPFKFVSSKEEFDNLQTTDESLATATNASEEKKPEKKMNIMVPPIQQITPITIKKTFAKITPNYIRLPSHLNLPIATHYEPTEVDHTFVKTHQDRYLFKGKRILTIEFLQKVIVEMELKAGKDMNLPRSKGWMMTFLETQYKDLLGYDNIEAFADLVYNYWKNRREEVKFPLLRQLWKPNPDEYNHMLAFRPREREKRSLRRTNRVVQDEIIEELYLEFQVSSRLVDRIQLREELKMKQTAAQITSFYNQCKNFCPMPEFIDEVKQEDRVRDKDKIKGFHNNLDNYKNSRESVQNFTVHDSGNTQIDQKLSMVNFLSTVVHEAEQLGLNYEKMFHSMPFITSTGGGITKPPIPGDKETIITLPPGEGKGISDKPQQYMRFSLERYEDMLIRTFDEEDTPTYHVKPCSDYLELKRRKVDTYYFGSDDEGQTKDLRKNISASFKKWQNLQHIPRTISATSQN